MSKSDQELHNEGQEDGAKDWGSYDPPHGFFETLLGDTEKCSHENEMYDEGFRNARDQKD